MQMPSQFMLLAVAVLHGFMAAASMNRAGKLNAMLARPMVSL